MSRVPLKCYCPPQCGCGAKQLKTWRHAHCLTQAYLDNKGTISCAYGCSEYFIQHGLFKCKDSTVHESFKSQENFLQALGQAMTMKDTQNYSPQSWHFQRDIE